MANDQASFEYSDQQLAALTVSISQARMTSYLGLASENLQYAILLYEWNTALSSAFYALLQGLEVTLRNAIHRKLIDAFGREDWYDSEVMEERQQEAVRNAKKQIERNGKVITPGRVVARVTFAFWVELCGPIYAQTLWDAHLKSIFNTPMGRKTAYRRLDRIRKLRNRIALHESILERSLKDDFSIILETVHWVCPVTAKWLRAKSAFHPIFAAMPPPPKS